MRLTEKTNYQGQDFVGVCNVNFREMVNKLGQLEDIEEELGIDLITLFKAINGFGFWSIYGFEKIEECRIDFVLKCFITEDFEEIYFKDYGKTWALTEKELENEIH